MWRSGTFRSVISTRIPTHYLQAAVRVDLPHVAGAEPPLTVLIHEEVLAVAFGPVVAHGDVGPADQHLPSRVRLVFTRVATCENTR